MAKKEAAGWGSRVGLILAMAGNAVGLGNFLRFPVQAINNGGGSFIIPYLVCFLLLGIPFLFVEWSVGRFGGREGNHSTPFILNSMNKAKLWKYVGVFGIFTNLAVAAYYCYLESWTLSYVYHTIIDTFGGQTQSQVANHFSNYTSLSSAEPIIFWIFCLLLNTWILSKGLSGGVEKMAKIGMPLLIVFGVFLAIKAVTLKSGTDGAINDGVVGLNFLWKPDYSSIWTPSVWLAAAGQIFFTLSIGMGSIQCYASYVRSKDDIALNAMSAGWMNGFVEVVLGSAIIIPISVGYLGIDGMKELISAGGGLGLSFKTLPYLFEQWGGVLGVIAGIAWFGLLFFAGITSSLAMGTPVMGFFQDEFGWKEKNAAWFFGGLVLILGLPTVLYFNNGVFDEYDYWAGTVSLVVFALLEIILFSFIFGIKRGWEEINIGADIKIPIFFKYIILIITPILLTFIFVGSLKGIGETVTHKDSKAKIALWNNPSDLENNKMDLLNILSAKPDFKAEFLDPAMKIEQIQALKNISMTTILSIEKYRDLDLISKNSNYKNEKITGENKTMTYKNISRIFLVFVWVAIAFVVYLANKKRELNKLTI